MYFAKGNFFGSDRRFCCKHGGTGSSLSHSHAGRLNTRRRIGKAITGQATAGNHQIR
jgi:hypothetical protein